CTVRVLDSEGGVYKDIEDDEAEIKIRGNSTSSGAKKPFNIKFSSKTNLLGMGKNKKWCLLANMYDKTLIRNQLVFDIAYQTRLRYTPKYRVVEVFVNGYNQGCYLLTDAIKADKTRVDINTDENEFILERDERTDPGRYYFSSPYYGIRFGVNEPEEPTDDQKQWLDDFLYEAETAISSADYSRISQYFDIDSMVDFYIVFEYSKEVDVDVGSTRFYIKGGKIYGGPCWDFDLSCGNYDRSYYNWIYGSSGDSAEGYWARDRFKWYLNLWNCEEFKAAVKTRYAELQDVLVNVYEDNALGKNLIDRTVEKYSSVIDRNYTIWSIYTKYSELERAPLGSYGEEIEYMRDWFRRRNNWFTNRWGIPGAPQLSPRSSYTLENYHVYGVPEKTAAFSVASNFLSDNTYCISPNGVEYGYSDYVANGARVTCGGASCKLMVRGDPVADGQITAADYVFAKRYCLGTVQADEDEFYACNVDGQGDITAVDYVMIKRHVLGTYKIKP
ncbi:MAG: CotH kinase family protein, partial [Clostridia bacterium]|nr:CotH kinase family protein [Clostridia bacterium]